MSTECQEGGLQGMLGSLFLLFTLKDPVQGDQDALLILPEKRPIFTLWSWAELPIAGTTGGLYWEYLKTSLTSHNGC